MAIPLCRHRMLAQQAANGLLREDGSDKHLRILSLSSAVRGRPSMAMELSTSLTILSISLTVHTLFHINDTIKRSGMV